MKNTKLSETNTSKSSTTIQATLTQGSVSQHLISMSWPMIWGILATMSFNAVDTWFVSRLGDGIWDQVTDAQLGDLALAAMGYTFPVVMIITSVAIGLGAGASSAIARAMGGGNTDRVSRLATDALSLATIISIAVSLAGWLTIDWVFMTLLGASEETMPLIREYMVIWYLSAPLLLVPMILLSALRALGFAAVQGVVMIVGAVFNILLDPFLIFGWWGLPRLGLEGAAYATLASRVFTLIVALYFLQGRLHVLTSPLAKLSQIQQSWMTLFHIGIPSMVSNLIIPLSSMIVFALISHWYGDQAVAGLGVALRIEPIALIVFYALSAVVGPLFGQNQGAGLYGRLFEGLSVVTRFCFIFGLLLALIISMFGDFFAGLFSDSPEILAVAVLYLMLVPLSYGAYGLVMSVIAMLNGLGMPFYSLAISFSRVIAIYLPAVFIGNYFWGITGLIAASSVSNIITGVMAYYVLKSLIKKDEAKFVQARAS